jgi:hypothetical protein
MAITAPSPVVGSHARRPRVASPVRPVPRRSTGLRLTRRGRAVATLAITLPVVLGAVVCTRTTADAGTTAVVQMRATGHVVVQPGESLWSVAREVAPQADPRETVLRLRELNHLSSDSVEVGQALVVPVSR